MRYTCSWTRPSGCTDAKAVVWGLEYDSGTVAPGEGIVSALLQGPDVSYTS